jgi:hypothetical protein
MVLLLTALACLTTATAKPSPTPAPPDVGFNARSLLTGDGLFPTLRPPADTASPLERLTRTPWGSALGEHPNPARQDYCGGSPFGLTFEF